MHKAIRMVFCNHVLKSCQLQLADHCTLLRCEIKNRSTYNFLHIYMFQLLYAFSLWKSKITMSRVLNKILNHNWLYNNFMAILHKVHLNSIRNDNSFKRLQSFLMDKPRNLILMVFVNVDLQHSIDFRQNNTSIVLGAT